MSDNTYNYLFLYLYNSLNGSIISQWLSDHYYTSCTSTVVTNIDSWESATLGLIVCKRYHNATENNAVDDILYSSYLLCTVWYIGADCRKKRCKSDNLKLHPSWTFLQTSQYFRMRGEETRLKWCVASHVIRPSTCIPPYKLKACKCVWRFW
jgi:hypothetical protein